MKLLSIENLRVSYGAVQAVQGMTVELGAGETIALVGPNGAGKSTLLLTIAGVLKPQSGTITYQGQQIGGMPAQRLVARGIALVPETRDVFTKLTVHENLLIGASLRTDKPAVLADIDRINTLFPRLAERRTQTAGFLSGGEQQMLAIGRALMSRPKALTLDEPTLGPAPVVTDTVYGAIADLKKEGVSLILVEQNSERAFGVCDRAYILASGRVEASGTPAEMATSNSVEDTYFGGPRAGTVAEGAGR